MSLAANLQLANNSLTPIKLDTEKYFSAAGLTATSYLVTTDAGVGANITPEGIFTAYSSNDVTATFHSVNTDGKVSLFLNNDSDINWNMTLDGAHSDSLQFINDSWQTDFASPFYALTMQTDGRIGIGTESPATDVTLDVQAFDSVSASLRMFNNATNVDVRLEAGTGVGRVGTKSNTPLRLFANDVDGIYVGTDGNVGIGTASDPSYTLTVDGDINLIGSQAQGGNVLAYWFETANTNDAFRDSKVGIGTAGLDPEATLQVIEGNGSGIIQIGKDLAGYDAEYQYINFGGNVDTDFGWQIGKADTSGDLSTTKGFYIYGLENQVKALAIDIDGNVAIGSNNVAPTALLDVRGGVIFNDGGADFDFRVEGQTDANLLFTDASTDRVGIGLNNPQYKLDIVGDINYTSRLYQNDVLMGMWTDDAGDIYRMSNVGIGVADPQQKFHIRDVNSNLRFYNSAGVFVVDAVNDAADNNINLRLVGEELEIVTNGAERVRVDDTGQVGINTVTPGHMLDVNGAVGLSPNTEGHDTHFFTTNAVDDGRYQIKSGATINVDIQANGNTYFNGGNVGIGIEVPTEKLQVIGDILIDTGTTSTLYFDNNTNWFQYESGQYRIGLASTEHIRINSSGYVGINEDTPDSPLHIKGAGGTASSIRIEESANSRYTLIQQNNGSATFRAVGAGNTLGLYTDGSEWVRINTAGQVGINQINPLATLHVDGTVIIENDTINELTFTGTGLTNILSETTTGFQLGSTAAGYLSFITNNTEAIHVDDAQLVGINNSNPQHRLDVTGDINFTGELKYSGNSFVTNNTNNYVMTATGAGTLNGEVNLTFDGTLLDVTGNITASQTITGDTVNTSNLAVDTDTLYVAVSDDSVGVNKVPDTQYALDVSGDVNISGSYLIGGLQLGYWNTDGPDVYRLSNVGIQTSDPQYELDVTHNHAGDTSIVSFNNDSSGSAHLRVGFDATNHYDIYRDGAVADIIHDATQNTANIIWQIAADEKLRIASTGYVGIGTNNPTTILDIEEAGVTSLTLTNTTDSTTLRLTSDATTASIGTVSNTPLQIKGNDLLLATFDYSGLDLELGQVYSINGIPLIPDLDLTAFSVNWPQYTSNLYDSHRINFNDIQNVETTWDWNYAKREMRNKSWFIEQDFPPTHGAVIVDASQDVVWWIDRAFGIDGATYFTDYLRFDVAAGNMLQSNIKEIKFLDFKLYALAADVLYVIDLLDDTAYMYANNGTYKYNSNVFNRNASSGYTRINSIGIQSNNNSDFDVVRDPFANQDNYTRPLHYWVITDTAGESLYKPSNDDDDVIYHNANANTGAAVAFINETIVVGEQGANASLRVTRDFTAITGGGWAENSDINPTQSDYQIAAWSSNINDVATIDGSAGSEVVLIGTDDGLSIRHSLSGEIFTTGSFTTPFMNEGRKVAFPLNDLNDRSFGGSSTTLTVAGPVAFTGTSPFGIPTAEFTGGYLSNTSVSLGEARNISLFLKADNDINPVLKEEIIKLSNGVSTGRIELFTDSNGFLNATWSDDNNSTTDSITSITDLHDGNWHHVYVGTIQEDTTNYYMYVDGQHVGKVAITNSGGTLALDQFLLASTPNSFYGEIANVYVSDVPYRKEDIAFEYKRMRAGLASSTSVLSTDNVKQISVDSKGGYAIVVTNDNIANIIDAKSGDIYNIDASPGGTLNHADITSMDSGAAPHYFLGGSTAIEQLAQSTDVLNGGVPINAASNIDNDVSTYVTTATGAGKVSGEQNLTFNGTLLNVTGDINYTGTLQKNGVDFVNNAADNRLATTNADGTLNAEANLTFGTTLTIAAATTSQAIAPAADSTYELGTNTDRWSHVYTDDITVTNGLTLGGGGGITGLISNDADNRITTATGSGDLNAETNLTFDGTTLDVTGSIDVSGTLSPKVDSTSDLGTNLLRWANAYIDDITITNGITIGSNVAGNLIPSVDSTYSLGSSSLRWSNLYVDSIGDTGQSLDIASTTINLPTGHVFDYATGDVTITHSANALTIAGGDLTATLSATSVISDGVTATTQTAADNSTKVATTAYADTAVTNANVPSITNDTNNYIATTTGSNSLNGEANLTFDGSVLNVTGNVDVSGTIESGTITPEVDSVSDLGSNLLRWANAYIDDITITNGISGLIASDTNNYLTTATGNGTLQAESGITFDGSALTITGNVNPVADSAHDLGTTLLRWANAYVDDVVVTNGITIGAGGITGLISNETDNRIITSAGGGLLNGEANLTFDGTLLNLTGNLDVSGTIESGTITPEVDSTSDLGSNLLRWANAYVDDITITNGISGLIANDTNNYITTSTGSGTLNAESALTFDGSVLNVTGNITPNSTLTHDLGTTLLYWNNAYINNITISGGITGLIADDTADYLTTSTGNGTLAAHSELTFNGTLLSITGNVDISGTLESGTITPEVTLTSDLGTTLLRWSTIYAGTVNLTSTSGLIASDTNNYITTATGSGTLQAESGLTFDGTTLNVTGDINFTGNILEDGSAYIAPVNIANDADNRITTATGNSDLNAEANLTFDGTTLTVATGGVTVGGNISVDTDSAYDIGADAARVANLFVDDITLTNGTTGLIDNDADNRITTAQADGTFNAEANLTFDGSELIISGVGYEQMTTSIGSSVGNQMVYADLDNMSVNWDENRAKKSIRNTSWYTELGAPPMHGMFTLDPNINTGSINWINREDGTTYMTFSGGNDTGRMFSGIGGWTSIYDVKFLDLKLYVCWKDSVSPVGGVIVIDFIRDEAFQFTTSGLYRWKGNTISNRNTSGEGWILIDSTADITVNTTDNIGTVAIARDPNGNSDFFGRPEQYISINMGKKTHLWNPLEKEMYDSSQTDGNGVVALFDNGGMFYDHYFVGPPAGQYFRYVDDFTTIDADGFTGTQFSPHADETLKGRAGTGIETSNTEANGFATGSALGNQNLVILNGAGHDTTIFHIDSTTPDNSGVVVLTDTYVSPYMKGDRFAAWPMKTTADVSGRGVTLAGLPSTSAGVFGDVATFNGTTDIATATVLASTFTDAEFSISFIFKSNDTTLPVADEYILNLEKTLQPGPWVSVRANTSGGIKAIASSDGTSTDEINYTGNLFDSNPHHIAYVCDGFKFYLYVDGNKVGQLDKTNVAADLVIEDIEIGGYNSANYFGGQIEMMSISKTAFERGEVEFEHYRMQQAIGGMDTTYTSPGTFTNFSADRSGDYMIVSADTSLHVIDARTGLIYSNQTITGGTYAEIVSVVGADLPHYAYYDNGSIVQVAPKVRLRS